MQNTIAAIPRSLHQSHSLTALEAMPADLRLLFGWRRLFALALDSVIAADPGAIRASERTPILLTLTTYCYAANLLASDDIEAACRSYGDIAYITNGEIISATELRQFRRSHRALIEGCLQGLFGAALEQSPQFSPTGAEDADSAAWAIHEFSQRRLNLAVLIDMAYSE